MVPLSNDDVQVVLAGLLCIADSLFQDLLRLFYVLAVEVDGVACYFSLSVVFAEDELGGLLVVVVCFGCMLFGLLAEVVSSTAVTAFVCLACFGGEVLMLALLLAGEVA